MILWSPGTMRFLRSWNFQKQDTLNSLGLIDESQNHGFDPVYWIGVLGYQIGFGIIGVRQFCSFLMKECIENVHCK